LMAPTETLARQHFQTIRKFLEGSRVNVGLLCGSMRSGQRRETLQQIANGELQIVVGTQSLLHVDSGFHRLGLVVIDEQHKFGVGQRARLRSEGIDPHYLVLSATPIPRTMAMTQFGDLDVSTLRDKPPGRGKVNTYLAKDDWLGRWWDFVRERMREGRQCFVVAPRVDPDGDPHAASDQETTGNDSAGSVTTPNANTEKGDAIPGANSNNDGASSEEDSSVEDQRVVSSAVGWFDALSKNEFADYRVRLLHGRMPPEEKRQVMDQFVAGEVQMLVCTSLIEVGIDVANATVMTVLGAERFGLAQLHQLRGRVSRSRHEGHVAVFTDAATTPEENERLKVLAETNDGFEIAEADFRLRGPGDLLGTRQSGMPPMRVADLQRDVQVLAVAREMAIDLVDEDATLSAEDLAALRHQVLKKYGVALDLGDVA
ncbi:MAG: helicase-related protein, partial [Planctomycetota bacterium]